MSEVKKYRRVLGLDLGIASVGWAITDHPLVIKKDAQNNEFEMVDPNVEPLFVDGGVRIFKVAEEGRGKDASSSTALTRNKRGMRRRNERKQLRVNTVKKLFSRILDLNVDQINKKINETYRIGNKQRTKIGLNPINSGGEDYDPIKLRLRALRGDPTVTIFQLLIISVYFSKHRGYLNMFNETTDELKPSKENEVRNWNDRINKSFSLIDIGTEFPSLAIEKYMKHSFVNTNNKVIGNETFSHRNVTKHTFTKHDKQKNNSNEDSLNDIDSSKKEKESRSCKKLTFEEKKVLCLPDYCTICHKKLLPFHDFNINSAIWQRSDLKNELRAIFEAQLIFHPELGQEILHNSRTNSNSENKEMPFFEAIIDIVFNQRFSEDAPGPLDKSSREKWLKSFTSKDHFRDENNNYKSIKDELKKNPDLKINEKIILKNVNERRMARKPFTELVEKCAIYWRDEVRMRSFSITTDILTIANKVSVITPYNVTNQQRAGILARVIDKYFEDGKITNKYIDSIVENQIEKNPISKSQDSKKGTSKEASEQGGHETLDKLYSTKIPLIKNYVNEYKRLFENGEYTKLFDTKLERLCDVLWRNFTPALRFSEIQNSMFKELVDDFDVNKKSIVSELIKEKQIEIEKNSVKMLSNNNDQKDYARVISTLEGAIKSLQIIFSSREHGFAYVLSEIKSSGTQQFSQKATLELINEAIQGKQILLVIKERVIEANKEWSKFSSNRLENVKGLKPWKMFFKQPADQELKNNAVVFRSINEARKIVKEIVKTYGNDKVNNIHISIVNLELGTELFRSAIERKKIEDEQNALKNNWTKIEKFLKDNGYENTKPNQIKRYLFERQLGKIIHTGESIDESKLYTKIGNTNQIIYEVDHIIPLSKVNNDSLANKNILSRSDNARKGARTYIQWIKEESFESNTKNSMVNRIKEAAKKVVNDKKVNQIDRQWTFNLVREDYLSLQLEFTSRNINDTRYISRFMSTYLTDEFKYFNSKNETGIETTVNAISGKLTSKMKTIYLGRKSAWVVNKKKLRDLTPFHHMLDALVLSQISSKSQSIWLNDRISINDFINTLRGEQYDGRSKNEKIEMIKSFTKEVVSKWSPKVAHNNPVILDLIEKRKENADLKLIEFVDEYLELNTKNDFKNFGTLKIMSANRENIVSRIVEQYIPVKLTKIDDKNDDIKVTNLLNPNEWFEKIQYFENGKFSINDYPFVSYKQDRKYKNKSLRNLDNPLSRDQYNRDEIIELIKNNQSHNSKYVFDIPKNGDLNSLNVFSPSYIGFVKSNITQKWEKTTIGELINMERKLNNYPVNKKFTKTIDFIGPNDSLILTEIPKVTKKQKEVIQKPRVHYVRFSGMGGGDNQAAFPVLNLNYNQSTYAKNFSEIGVSLLKSTTTHQIEKIHISLLGKKQTKK